MEYVELRSRQGNLVQEWRINDFGKEALKAASWLPEQKPEFMAPGAGRTTDHSRSVDRDPQMGALPLLDADSLKTRWRRQSETAKLATLDRKVRARQAAEKARFAA